MAEFINGWTDAPNAIATVVSTSVLPPRIAIMIAVVMNVAGATSGTAVAATISKGFVNVSHINLKTIAAAMIGLILWGLIAARNGYPISKSHSLIAGLVGAGFGSHGLNVAAWITTLLWSGWTAVAIGLLLNGVILSLAMRTVI